MENKHDGAFFNFLGNAIIGPHRTEKLIADHISVNGDGKIITIGAFVKRELPDGSHTFDCHIRQGESLELHTIYGPNNKECYGFYVLRKWNLSLQNGNPVLVAATTPDFIFTKEQVLGAAYGGIDIVRQCIPDTHNICLLETDSPDPCILETWF